MQSKIYNLNLEILKDKYYFDEVIAQDINNNYYWSHEWSAELYIKLAQLGFISTTYDTKDGLVLLPELQFEYSILDFKNLHISKKVKKLLQENNYRLSFNTQFEEVIEQISLQHRDNWFKNEYTELMQRLFLDRELSRNFQLISVELCSVDSSDLVAGEIGYIIGNTYTSLTGFSSRNKKHKNCGTLQLILLSHSLEERNFSFWNLGHPHMEYKKRLGAVTYTRKEFLKRWGKAISLS